MISKQPRVTIAKVVLRAAGVGLVALLTVSNPLAAQGSRAGQGPFSRAELLQYLRSIPHSQDYSVPYNVRKEASNKAVQLIRARGVNFGLPMGTFDQEFHRAGASSEVRLAIAESYRAVESAATAPLPTTSPFFGRWAIGIARSDDNLTTPVDPASSAPTAGPAPVEDSSRSIRRAHWSRRQCVPIKHTSC